MDEGAEQAAGLDAHDPYHLRSLRLAYEEWEDRQADPAFHRAWARFVLARTLELPDAVLIRPDSYVAWASERLPDVTEVAAAVDRWTRVT